MSDDLIAKSTAEAPARFVPEMITVAPPLAGPNVSLTAVTAGKVSKVNLSAAEVDEVRP